MTKTLSITHTTEYSYDGPVPFGIQQVRMTPKATRAQTIEDWSIKVEGGRRQFDYTDHHRNHVDLFSIEPGAEAIRIVATGTVTIAEVAGVLGPHEGHVPLWLYERPSPLTKAGRGVREIIGRLGEEAPLDRLHALSAAILDAVRYEVGDSHPDWTAEQAIEAGEGVCQDHTHIFLAAARALGHPARYVSGYLLMDGVEDQAAMHAWAEAHVAGLGWVGFDISNGISPDTRYVRVATGLDYADAAPVTGSRVGTPGERLTVHLRVAQQ